VPHAIILGETPVCGLREHGCSSCVVVSAVLASVATSASEMVASNCQSLKLSVTVFNIYVRLSRLLYFYMYKTRDERRTQCSEVGRKYQWTNDDVMS